MATTEASVLDEETRSAGDLTVRVAALRRRVGELEGENRRLVAANAELTTRSATLQERLAGQAALGDLTRAALNGHPLGVDLPTVASTTVTPAVSDPGGVDPGAAGDWSPVAPGALRILTEALSPDAPAGAGLAVAMGTVLEHAPDLPERLLVDACAGAQRLASWLELVQGDLVSALAVRRESAHLARLLPMTVDAEPLAPLYEEAEDLGIRSAVAEVAVVSGLTEYAVRVRLEMATVLPSEHPVVHQALRRGRLDGIGARLVAERTRAVADPVLRARVETDLLGDLARYTRGVSGQLTRTVTRGRLIDLTERAIARRVPEMFAEQADETCRTRSVQFRSLGAGLARMTLISDAAAVAEARAAVQSLTRAADTIDQGYRARGGAAVPGHVEAADVVLDVLRLAADHTLQPTLRTTDPTLEPAAAPEPAAPEPAAPAVVPAVTINLTVPLSTALGRSAAPAELDGHGLIPADLARRIIADHGRHATWRCLHVQDHPDSPFLGHVVGIGRAAHDPTYTPSAATAALVGARDRHCRFPGCRRPSSACDLDHVIPHARGGPTCETNLVPLCRHHHRLKTLARFSPSRDPSPGTLTWTTPTGHVINDPDEPPPF